MTALITPPVILRRFLHKLLCGFFLIEFLLAFFLLHLYSGGEMWEGISNQTHLVVLIFCLERLHQVTTSDDKVLAFDLKLAIETLEDLYFEITICCISIV